MNIKILSLAPLLFSSLYTWAQPCNMQLKDGQTMTISVSTWANPLGADKKYQKASEEAKAAMIAEFNNNIRSGAIPPASKAPYSFLAKKSDAKDGEEFSLRFTTGGKNYYSYVVCKDDTMYVARNRGVTEAKDATGAVYGFALQGVQKIPLKLKVGDILPSYEDIYVLVPQTWMDKVKIQVFSHNETSTSNEFGFATDTHTGETGFGNYTKTTTRAVYDQIDVDMRKTMKTSAHAVNYAVAKATGEEEVTVNGTAYKAIIIESENWSKMVMDQSYESQSEQANKHARDFYEKSQKLVDKMMRKQGYTNELGYTVTYKKEWFVPGLGMVNTETYDSFGGLFSQTKLTGLE
jgi:hypothetical protein